MGCVRLFSGDTECPLHVCQLSRPSDSTHFLGHQSFIIRFHQSPGWVLRSEARSEARASDLFPNFPEDKTPAYHTKRVQIISIQKFTGLSRPYLNTSPPLLSRIRRNIGDSGELRLFLRTTRPYDESKMRLLKTHSQAVWLSMEPGTREEKQLKETQTLQQGKSHPSKTCRVQPVWRAGGGRKGSRTCRIPPVWWGGTGKALWRTNHRKGTMTMQAVVDMEGNTGASTREKSCEKPPPGHRHGWGLDEEATNTRDDRLPHLQPRERGEGV